MFLNNKFSLWLLLFLSVIIYFLIGFYIIREEFFILIISFIFLFIFQLYFLKQKINLKSIFILGIIFRLSLIISIPELSQDFSRFIWDGSIQILGVNPYLYKPETLINLVRFPLSDLLYSKMGNLSAMNFSNYPPISQYVYYLSGYFNNGEIIKPIITIRIIYLISEIFLFFGIKSLLIKLGKNPMLTGWYFLNPMIIIETTGNLHGEILMILFLIFSFLYLFEKRIFLSSFFMSLSIATKLLPILIVPIFINYIGLRKFIHFMSYLLLFSFLIWFPLFEKEVILNFLNTIYLWFNSFEFNASIYYIIRFLGYKIFGYNLIKTISLFTPFLIVILICFFTFYKMNNKKSILLIKILLVYSIYFFISTTVHPWYIISLVILGIITGYLYPIIWSFTSLLSYSAYKNSSFEEEPLLIFIEYLIVYLVFIYEFKKKPLLNHIHKTNFSFIKIPPFSSG